MSIAEDCLKQSCSVPECKNQGKLFKGGIRYYVLGLCGMHYQRLSKDDKNNLKLTVTKTKNRRKYKKRAHNSKSSRLPITINGYYYTPIGKDDKKQYTIVDIEYKWIKKYNWMLDSSGYAYTIIKGQHTPLHRIICNPDDGFIVDHINRNPLDNRVDNLRQATTGQNMFNKKIYKNNTSGYKGVYLSDRKWKVVLRCKGKKISGGVYAVKEDAARKYNELAKEYHGDFASLNIIK